MTINKRSLENLKPAKKGEIRNPKGAPQKLPELTELLEKLLTGQTGNASELEVLLKVIISKAKKGNIKAAEFILDRYYGKPKQQVAIESSGKPNVITIHRTIIHGGARD